MLYIIATPIGNLEDITLRALSTLKKVSLILCEDTRRSKKLLSHYNIETQTSSYNDTNCKYKTKHVIDILKQDKDIALVSDSGTPGISDPGFYLVRECVKENIQVSPIPGTSAITASLPCSGLPTDKFSFLGFIPKTSGKKQRFLEEIKDTDHTAIFYESPHRIIKTLNLMSEIIPDKKLVIARELTKKFEEFIRGTVKEVYEETKDKKIKGEIVLILN